MSRPKILCLAFGLILTTFLVVEFSFLDGGIVETLDLPIQIHLTWQQGNMSSTITVTWQTKCPDSGSIVVYDYVSQDGDPLLHRHLVMGTCHTYVGASGYIHVVELTRLKPNSTYYFVCGGEKGGYSNERSFRTAPTQPSHLRFVVGGDCREIAKRNVTINNSAGIRSRMDKHGNGCKLGKTWNLRVYETNKKLR